MSTKFTHLRSFLVMLAFLGSSLAWSQSPTRIYVEAHYAADGTYIPGYWMDVQPSNPNAPTQYNFDTGMVPVAHGVTIPIRTTPSAWQLRQADPEYQRQQAARKAANAARRAANRAEQDREYAARRAASEAKRNAKVQLKYQRSLLTKEELSAQKANDKLEAKRRSDNAKQREKSDKEKAERNKVEHIGALLNAGKPVSPSDYRMWKHAQK